MSVCSDKLIMVLLVIKVHGAQRHQDTCAHSQTALLSSRVMQVMVTAVCQVGGDINAMAAQPWRSPTLQFVAGLGPRKAAALLKAVQVSMEGRVGYSSHQYGMHVDIGGLGQGLHMLQLYSRLNDTRKRQHCPAQSSGRTMADTFRGVLRDKHPVLPRVNTLRELVTGAAMLSHCHQATTQLCLALNLPHRPMRTTLSRVWS